MANRVFPEMPVAPAPQPTPVVLMVHREPLGAIEELLSISIHEVVNEPRCKRIVADFYRVTRAIENEAWLRRRFREVEDEAWTASHL